MVTLTVNVYPHMRQRFFFFVWTLAGWAKLSPDWEVEGTRVETALLDAAVAQRHHGRVVAIILANFRQIFARFRLYRHQFLQENMRFAAFFKIYQIIKLNFFRAF